MIVFGIDSVELDSATSTIGRALQVEFRPHESDFRGGPYCRAELAEGIILIQRNRDVLDREAFEVNWPPGWLVLYMDGLSDDQWQPYIDVLRTVRDPKVTKLR